MNSVTFLGEKLCEPIIQLKRTLLRGENNPTTEEVEETTEAEETTATYAVGTATTATSGSSKTGIEAIEGAEGVEAAGLHQHQAAPCHAPRQEPQPSTICLLTNPNCLNIEAPQERVHSEYTTKKHTTPSSPIISNQRLSHITGNQFTIHSNIKGKVKKDNTKQGITSNNGNSKIIGDQIKTTTEGLIQHTNIHGNNDIPKTMDQTRVTPLSVHEINTTNLIVTDINPVLIGYNGTHFESLETMSPEDDVRAIELVNLEKSINYLLNKTHIQYITQ